MLLLFKRNISDLFKQISIRAISSVMSGSLDQIPDVEIDPDGTFKYILIRIYAKQDAHGNEPSKLIVRGDKQSAYHADIYDKASTKIQKLGLDSECVGGGRIAHEAKNSKILVYGYSQGFGKADHSLTVEILKKFYKDYNITFSDEGY